MKYKNKNVSIVRPANAQDPSYDSTKDQVVVRYDDGSVETVSRTEVLNDPVSPSSKPAAGSAVVPPSPASEEVEKKRQLEYEQQLKQEDRSRKRQRDLDIEATHLQSPLPKAIQDLQTAKDNLARAKLAEKFLPAETERVEKELKQRQETLKNSEKSVESAEKAVAEAQARVDELTKKQQDEANETPEQRAKRLKEEEAAKKKLSS